MSCYCRRLSQSTMVHSFKPMLREEESGFVNHPYKGMKQPKTILNTLVPFVNNRVFILWKTLRRVVVVGFGPEIKGSQIWCATESWEFIFLGANIDAIQTASSYGIKQNRASNFCCDPIGVNLNFCCVSEAISECRADGEISSEWADEIKSDFKKRGKWCLGHRQKKAVPKWDGLFVYQLQVLQPAQFTLRQAI